MSLQNQITSCPFRNRSTSVSGCVGKSWDATPSRERPFRRVADGPNEGEAKDGVPSKSLSFALPPLS